MDFLLGDSSEFILRFPRQPTSLISGRRCDWAECGGFHKWICTYKLADLPCLWTEKAVHKWNIMMCLLLVSVCRLKSMSSDQPTKKKQQISVTAAGCFTYWRMKLSWRVVCRLAPAADVQNHWPRAVLLPSPTSFSSPRRGRFVTCWAGELKWAMDGNMNLTAVPSLREEWKQLCFLYIFL